MLKYKDPLFFERRLVYMNHKNFAQPDLPAVGAEESNDAPKLPEQLKPMIWLFLASEIAHLKRKEGDSELFFKGDEPNERLRRIVEEVMAAVIFKIEKYLSILNLNDLSDKNSLSAQFLRDEVAVAFLAVSNRERIGHMDEVGGLDSKVGNGFIRFGDDADGEKRLQRELDKAPETSQKTLISIDIDLFARFNDYWSHATGDAAIKYLARIMKLLSREQDLLVRFSGDELGIIAEGTPQEACLLAERVRVYLEQHPVYLLGVSTKSGLEEGEVVKPIRPQRYKQILLDYQAYLDRLPAGHPEKVDFKIEEVRFDRKDAQGIFGGTKAFVRDPKNPNQTICLTHTTITVSCGIHPISEKTTKAVRAAYTLADQQLNMAKGKHGAPGEPRNRVFYNGSQFLPSNGSGAEIEESDIYPLAPSYSDLVAAEPKGA